MNGTRWMWRLALAAAVQTLATGAFAAEWLRTAVDPTCAVIERAEYDAEQGTVRVTGRSAEAVTVRIYDQTADAPLVTLRRPTRGRWTLEYPVVGGTPGMVVVQSESGCASFRLIPDDRLGSLHGAAATVALGAPRQPVRGAVN